ncbi:sporulation protein YtxC [Pseudalkalibacillus sp. R45]|uniref:sporulation protein YtxC n=1 Tax=Pseudalkalibacillus sp. R45 TaxID=3457433 RepID=UPI003FCDFD56
MVTIHFLDEKEGHYLFKRITKLLNNQNIPNRSTPIKIHYTDENALDIYLDPRDPVSDMLKPTILLFLAKHIIRTREDAWILRILETEFYFTDEDEQLQILSITQSLIEENTENIPLIRGFPPREDMIVNALEDFFDSEMIFSYESFLQFRLKPYRELLTKYIECAIDEFKFEQEYQDFINQLRQFVKSRVSLFSTVHLKFEGERFRIYNEHYYELTEADMEQLVSGKAKAYLDAIASDLLKVLIEIAPEKIYLYTDSDDDSMNRTIQNVFQERVRILPNRKFAVK